MFIRFGLARGSNARASEIRLRRGPDLELVDEEGDGTGEEAPTGVLHRKRELAL